MRLILTFCSVLLCIAGVAQDKIKGPLSTHADIGNPKLIGGAVYDKKAGTYNITGGGYNIWFNRDEAHYVYSRLTGDFTLTANFAFIGEGTDPHRKTGWMVRSSLADTGIHISAVLHGDGLTVMQWRTAPGLNMRDPEDERFAQEKKLYGVIQLQRKGQEFIMRIAEKQGDPLIEVGRKAFPELGGPIFAGLFVCSHNPEVTEQVTVRNVRIEQ